MSKNHLTLTSFSTAMFSTWHFCQEWGILFDCGDGFCAAMQQKARKVKHVFISHADRDHLTGLLQFNQLNARPGLKIYFPKDCGSFPALAEFCQKFDSHVEPAQWIPLDDGATIQIREDLVVQTQQNEHVSEPGVKSLGFVVESIHRKLKPEYSQLNGPEIGELRKKHGKEAITTPTHHRRLFYSGDTPAIFDGRYRDTETLIHEATFLTNAEFDSGNPHRNKHSSLEQVMQFVAESKIDRLVLSHFSSRYSKDQIRQAIERYRDLFNVQSAIYVIEPGCIVHDVLADRNVV